jgi:hypothetical protein
VDRGVFYAVEVTPRRAGTIVTLTTDGWSASGVVDAPHRVMDWVWTTIAERGVAVPKQEAV